MIELASWIAAIIFVEATVEIEVTSDIFAGLRYRVSKIKWIGWYFHGLFSCGYCLSVWVSALVALFIPTIFFSNTPGSIAYLAGYDISFIIANYIVKVFVIHRLSNAWHEFIYRWLERLRFIQAFKKDDIEFIGGENATIHIDNTNNSQRSGIEGDAQDIHTK